MEETLAISWHHWVPVIIHYHANWFCTSLHVALLFSFSVGISMGKMGVISSVYATDDSNHP